MKVGLADEGSRVETSFGSHKLDRKEREGKLSVEDRIVKR